MSAGILLAGGAVSLATNPASRTRMLALMPLLFGIQQFAEGMVWLTVGRSPAPFLHTVSVNFFLMFALVIWPTWLPIALVQAETDLVRRRHLEILLAMGVTISVVGAGLLIHWRPQAHVAGHSIHYDYGRLGGAPIQVIYLLAYVVPTVLPFFIASLPLGRTLGAVFIASLIVTMVIKEGALASVWCFFAGLVSLLIAMALHRDRSAALVPTVLPV